ncbi:MAG: SDR family oxidoreductase [Deltaproteobacteria bacterium]|nr:SDR family oxidoreductase [Deltaproteobacteria bacterium]
MPKTKKTGRAVAVTGTSEFLGAGLLGLMETDPRYDRILAVDVREPERLGRKTRFAPVDLTSPDTGSRLAELFDEHGIDTLVHLAFLSNPSHDSSYAHELQVAGTMHLLNAASAANLKKVIMQGSTMSYGARPDNPNFLTEDSPLRPNPDCAFARDLADVEQQFASFRAKNPQMVSTMLRLGSMLGREVDTFMARLLRLSLVPVVMGQDPLLQFIHEDDALRALKLVTDEDHDGVFNIVAEGLLPLSTVLSLAGRLPLPLPAMLAERLGGFLWTFQAINIPPALLDYLRYLWVADGSRSRKELGFQPTHDIRQTLARFLREGRTA